MKHFVLIGIMALCGCSSPLSALISPAIYRPQDPFREQEQEIESLYASGRISPEKYLELKQQLVIERERQRAERTKIAQAQSLQEQTNQQPTLTFKQQVMMKQMNPNYQPQGNLTFEERLFIEQLGRQTTQHQTSCAPNGSGGFNCSGTSH